MKERAMPFMLEKVRRCRSCGAEVDRPPLGYEEMPFCTDCLSRELKNGERLGVHWRRIGNYVEISQGGQTPH
jgi:hypothetical protein